MSIEYTSIYRIYLYSYICPRFWGDRIRKGDSQQPNRTLVYKTKKCLSDIDLKNNFSCLFGNLLDQCAESIKKETHKFVNNCNIWARPFPLYGKSDAKTSKTWKFSINKSKIIFMSNFVFCHNDFKRCLLYIRRNASASAIGLSHACFNSFNTA